MQRQCNGDPTCWTVARRSLLPTLSRSGCSFGHATWMSRAAHRRNVRTTGRIMYLPTHALQVSVASLPRQPPAPATLQPTYALDGPHGVPADASVPVHVPDDHRLVRSEQVGRRPPRRRLRGAHAVDEAAVRVADEPRPVHREGRLLRPVAGREPRAVSRTAARVEAHPAALPAGRAQAKALCLCVRGPGARRIRGGAAEAGKLRASAEALSL